MSTVPLTPARPVEISAETRLAARGFLIRYTGRTRELYDLALRLFFDWCAEEGLEPLRDVTRMDVEAYGRHLEEVRGNSPATVSQRLTIVRGFYKLAEIDERIRRSPAAHIKLPKSWRDGARTKYLTLVEAMLVLRAVDEQHPAAAAVIHMMMTMGLRVSEALAVQVEDFRDVVNGMRVLRGVGKGDKPFTMPIPPEALQRMERAAGGRATGHLLLQPECEYEWGGTPLSRAAVQTVLTNALRAAGLPKRITPHALRHTYATNGLAHGNVTLEQMQRALRHADPRTTMGYDHTRENLAKHANHQVGAMFAIAG
ncbi:tyrosine-type recombinase/integrase [Microbacterium dauci]|uniref:Tyrosine-type recombinase/integrase n=1 Tax=Microbacterium dauci TaxID=3048008 RepID=A0ABT6ZAR6_9MICO|nr:tyrosine-type recombinase/integrase [Microbacterium sp. LX3-4]MDJ1113256.1 tyrosine-type recombinase/integrase [Microbacterium sp. LX3-4]